MRRCAVCALLGAGVALSALADDAWFDAGIANYESWPEDGSDKVVTGAGVWRGTQFANLAGAAGGKTLQVSSPESDGLSFAMAEARAVSAEPVIVRTTVRLAVFKWGEAMTLPDADSKGALAVVEADALGTRAYCGLAKDPDGATNVWVRLAGAEPSAEADDELVFEFKSDGGAGRVRYTVNGHVLTDAAGEAWQPVVFSGAQADELSGAFYLGEGSIASLSGSAAGDVPRIALAIPALDHMTVKSVTANGFALEPTDGAYLVQAGSTVVVRFAPESGYVLTASDMSFRAGDGAMTLPEEGRPSAVAVSSLVTINEIMASNGSSLKTKSGVAGIDWVELYNSGDAAIDLTGYYFGNDPTKKKSKWKDWQIAGSCVVPAKGYKILWCDGDGLCTRWAADEAHVACNISTTAGKHTIFLAPETDAKKAFQQIRMPAMIKDVSYGRGWDDQASAPSDACWYFRTATPGEANTEHGYGAMTPEVAFSEPHGYKTGPFTLTLACAAAPSAPIHYTLDGTSPTTASARYTEPLVVSNTTCIRAAVPQDNTVLQRDFAATYIFLDEVLAQGQGTVPKGFPADKAVNGQAFRYGLNQGVVNGTDRARLLNGFTNSIATLSIVVDPANLFDASRGIYVNAYEDGRDWERPMLLEQFNPAGDAVGFSVPAGIRIRGAASRKESYAKHSFRFFFRSEYGMGSLDYPLFGDEGADSFDRVDLRTSQNYSWANENCDQDTFIHECFSRDSQGAMDEHYTRSRYCNLFVNGQYWGLYQTQERGEENFAETYNGGAADDYDVIKTSHTGSGNYETTVSAGGSSAWDSLRALAQQGFDGDHADNYCKAMGLKADGTRDPDRPVLLNPTNLMVFMISAHYACDCDSPFSVTGGFPNNLYALRDRTDRDDPRHDGFFFLRHDAEHSMGVRADKAATWSQYDDDPTGYGVSNADTSFAKFNPALLHAGLCKNPAYCRAFADVFYRHCLKPGGAMTAPVARARFEKRMAEIDDAIVCECARWSTDVTKRNREAWLKACTNSCIAGFIEKRMPEMLKQYRSCGWYPSIDPPQAFVAEDKRLRLVSPDGGTVYYTTDGSDPCRADGTPGPSAVACAGDEGLAVPSAGLTLAMRVLKDGEWSALDTLAVKGAPTVRPGLAVEVTAADAEAAVRTVVLEVEVPTDDDAPVVDEVTYRGYFVLRATPVADRDGVYAVEAVLDDAAVRPVIAATDEIAEPFAVGETGGEVTIRTLPGLRYSLLRGAAVDAIDAVRDERLATGGTLTLRDTGDRPPAAFYRVSVAP